jgi:hypothetical protein
MQLDGRVATLDDAKNLAKTILSADYTDYTDKADKWKIASLDNDKEPDSE